MGGFCGLLGEGCHIARTRVSLFRVCTSRVEYVECRDGTEGSKGDISGPL